MGYQIIQDHILFGWLASHCIGLYHSLLYSANIAIYFTVMYCFTFCCISSPIAAFCGQESHQKHLNSGIVFEKLLQEYITES